MKRVTIKDIAEMLNISVSTVSRALKDHPDISNAVKLKVKEAAEAFNYIPNDFAINFRKKSSKVIGLIIPEMSMFFIPSIIKGISHVLHREGYHFFLLSSEESLKMEKENIMTCINSRVDGILISLTKYTKDLSHLQKAKDIELPIVIFDKTISQNHFDEIVFDNGLNVRMAAEKLIESNCKRILAVFGDENLKITQTRRDFFLEKLKEHPEIKCRVIYCKSAEDVKYQLNTILNDEHFDGYFAMSDETLAGLHSSLIKSKLQTSAIKVIAITEGILPKYLDDSYECIINDGYHMGAMAASKILEIIKGSKI
ncbi:MULTISPECIES: LacI family DNA-binding transcriptional regulator [Chryseobacterium]|uniref:LacI family DNA-binding transcriptional regulator n=1 Tax=Chryseobacterium TaxID=59732 RepID=UPI000F4F5D6B|nr:MULTISPECIES: LacI family DNA-binding transcriptional regulator [Chryseobacterium]AZB33335.1 LacI family transcriptional regulator [Chryseobacterium bernardetii]UCA61158.1 LacI family transcriptional regulator [Chryseobacterium rhizoplanae]